MAETPTVEKVVELLRDQRFAMITTPTQSGDLHSRPMTLQEVTDDGDLWFFIDASSDQAREISVAPRINASFAESNTWISVAGTAEVLRDEAKIEEHWNKVVEAWFPGGRQDPNVALLHVRSDSAHYWNTPGGTVASVIAFAKAKVAGQRYEGDSATVDLP